MTYIYLFLFFSKHYTGFWQLHLNYLFCLKNKENISKDIYYLSKTNNLNEAAKNLYSVLRKIKKDKYKSIAVEKIPNEGIGKTINDRLKRASNFK